MSAKTNQKPNFHLLHYQAGAIYQLQKCHCVPGNNDTGTFKSHQLCLAPLEYGIDLIPSCISRGTLQQEGSQGDVPVGCTASWKTASFGVPSDNACSVLLYSLQAERFALDGSDTKLDIWIGLEEVKNVLFLHLKIGCQNISQPAFPSECSVKACLGVNLTGLSDLKL